MNTLDILIRICEKREELTEKGLNGQDALIKAMQMIAEEYHICSASMTKLVALWWNRVAFAFILKLIDLKKNELESDWNFSNNSSSLTCFNNGI